METHDPAIDEALTELVSALNNLDRERLEACFAEDATVFLPWGGRRKPTIWNERFDEMRATLPGPPYQDIQPRDVRVDMLGSVALVTFHLPQPDISGRRTLVLKSTSAGWKIMHLHASTLPL
jgi:ketosteroid isomerase-like protein